MNMYIEQTIATTSTSMSMSTPLTRAHILALLRGVQDPHSGLDIVTLGWVGPITIMHPEVIVALRPAGRVRATHYAIETAIERTLHPHLGLDHLRLYVCWNTEWHPDDEW
jgi:metal-sulfur cluster biosynthetic enzyme